MSLNLRLICFKSLSTVNRQDNAAREGNVALRKPGFSRESHDSGSHHSETFTKGRLVIMPELWVMIRADLRLAIYIRYPLDQVSIVSHKLEHSLWMWLTEPELGVVQLQALVVDGQSVLGESNPTQVLSELERELVYSFTLYHRSVVLNQEVLVKLHARLVLWVQGGLPGIPISPLEQSVFKKIDGLNQELLRLYKELGVYQPLGAAHVKHIGGGVPAHRLVGVNVSGLTEYASATLYAAIWILKSFESVQFCVPNDTLVGSFVLAPGEPGTLNKDLLRIAQDVYHQREEPIRLHSYLLRGLRDDVVWHHNFVIFDAMHQYMCSWEHTMQVAFTLTRKRAAGNILRWLERNFTLRRLLLEWKFTTTHKFVRKVVTLLVNFTSICNESIFSDGKALARLTAVASKNVRVKQRMRLAKKAGKDVDELYEQELRAKHAVYVKTLERVAKVWHADRVVDKAVSKAESGEGIAEAPLTTDDSVKAITDYLLEEVEAVAVAESLPIEESDYIKHTDKKKEERLTRAHTVLSAQVFYADMANFYISVRKTYCLDEKNTPVVNTYFSLPLAELDFGVLRALNVRFTSPETCTIVVRGVKFRSRGKDADKATDTNNETTEIPTPVKSKPNIKSKSGVKSATTDKSALKSAAKPTNKPTTRSQKQQQAATESTQINPAVNKAQRQPKSSPKLGPNDSSQDNTQSINPQRIVDSTSSTDDAILSRESSLSVLTDGRTFYEKEHVITYSGPYFQTYLVCQENARSSVNFRLSRQDTFIDFMHQIPFEINSVYLEAVRGIIRIQTSSALSEIEKTLASVKLLNPQTSSDVFQIRRNPLKRQDEDNYRAALSQLHILTSFWSLSELFRQGQTSVPFYLPCFLDWRARTYQRSSVTPQGAPLFRFLYTYGKYSSAELDWLDHLYAEESALSSTLDPYVELSKGYNKDLCDTPNFDSLRIFQKHAVMWTLFSLGKFRAKKSKKGRVSWIVPFKVFIDEGIGLYRALYQWHNATSTLVDWGSCVILQEQGLDSDEVIEIIQLYYGLIYVDSGIKFPLTKDATASGMQHLMRLLGPNPNQPNDLSLKLVNLDHRDATETILQQNAVRAIQNTEEYKAYIRNFTELRRTSTESAEIPQAVASGSEALRTDGLVKASTTILSEVDLCKNTGAVALNPDKSADPVGAREVIVLTDSEGSSVKFYPDMVWYDSYSFVIEGFVSLPDVQQYCPPLLRECLVRKTLKHVIMTLLYSSTLVGSIEQFRAACLADPKLKKKFAEVSPKDVAFWIKMLRKYVFDLVEGTWLFSQKTHTLCMAYLEGIEQVDEGSLDSSKFWLRTNDNCRANFMYYKQNKKTINMTNLAGKRITWVAPLGFSNPESRDSNRYSGAYVFDTKKTESAFLANLTHCVDAGLIRTIATLSQEKKLTPFSSIHDCISPASYETTIVMILLNKAYAKHPLKSLNLKNSKVSSEFFDEKILVMTGRLENEKDNWDTFSYLVMI